MNKKIYLFLGVAAVIIVVVAVILTTKKTPEAEPLATNESQLELDNVVREPEVSTEGIFDENIPEVALDSSEFTPEQIQELPVNKPSMIKFGVNGLEETELRAKSDAMVLLGFSATDDKVHLFRFLDPSMSSVSALFSKEEGDKGINFISPGPGVYKFVVDDVYEGELILE